MASTVITTTVSMLNNATFGGSLAAIGMLILVALLVQKELISTSRDHRWLQLSRVMNVGILPLMLAFVLIVFFKIVQALS